MPLIMKVPGKYVSAMLLVMTACGPVARPSLPALIPVSPESSLAATLLPDEPPPARAESEFETDFSRHSVPYSEILSGGPPKYGIPTLNAPRFVSVSEADAWLKPVEPVILVEVG